MKLEEEEEKLKEGPKKHVNDVKKRCDHDRDELRHQKLIKVVNHNPSMQDKKRRHKERERCMFAEVTKSVMLKEIQSTNFETFKYKDERKIYKRRNPEIIDCRRFWVKEKRQITL